MNIYDNGALAASCVFLALFTFAAIGAGFAAARKGWASSYSFVFMFCIVRIAAEVCMVVFSTLGFGHQKWLVAYLILSAEGFFMLLVSSFGLLAYAEYLTFGRSILSPSDKQINEYATRSEKTKAIWTAPVVIFTWLLVPANILVIAGGSMLANGDPDSPNYDSLATKSLGVRVTGQIIFLILVIVLGLTSIWLSTKKQVRNYTVMAASASSIPLLIRGIYGVVSCFINELNYFRLDNYSHSGLSTKFVACNYVLGTTMEFSAAFILLSSYFIRNPYKRSLDTYHELDFIRSNS
jgi:hypothetical protein